MAQQLGTLLIDIKSDTTQLIQGFNKAESAVNKTTKSMTYAVKGLIGAFVGLNTLDLAKNFTKQMDMITESNNKLLLSTKNTNDFITAQKELFRVAQETNQGYSETVDLYSNLAISMEAMGKSQAEIIRTVETVNKAIAISGSNAQQSASAVLQLGQAFGSGKLSGDELSSLTENSKGLVKAIADGLGVAVGDLKQLGSEGKITSELLSKALAKSAEDVDSKFGAMTKSTSQGFTNLTNSISVMAGQFGNAIGFGDDFAGMLFKISNYLDTNKDDIVNYGIVTTATISKVVDNFLLLGADIKNVAELLLDSVGIMAFGALKSVSNVLLEITKGLNSINLSSDETLANAQSLYDFANKGYTNFAKSVVNNIEDMDKAYLKANVSIEDRIKSMKKEYAFQKEKAKNPPLIEMSNDEMVKKTLNPYASGIDEINKKWKEQFDILIKNKKDTSGVVEAWTKELNQYEKDFNDKKAKEGKTNEKLISDKLNQERNYYESIKDYANLWKIEEQKIREENNQLTSNQLNKLIEVKKLAFEMEKNNVYESAKLDLSYYEKKLQLLGDEYDKQVEIQGIKYAQSILDIESSNRTLEQKQSLIDKETELHNLTLSRMENERNTEFQETMNTFYDDMIESQRELNSSLYEWGDIMDSNGNKVSNIAKQLASLANAEIKTKKEKANLDKKYEKQFTKYAGDVEKTKELEQSYTRDTNAINEQSINNQIEGYSNLAGAIAGLYEEGSSKAEKWLAIQKVLSVVSGITAIASAMANGDGYTAVARGLAVAATLVSFGWKKGGSGGGGSSKTPKESQFEIREKEINNTFQPMLDRLDRQIELLESIDKQGSASAIGLVGAKIGFERSYALAVNDILKSLPNDVRGYGLDFNNALAPTEERLGFNIADVLRIKKSGWDKSEKRIYTDFNSLSKNNNMLKLISDYYQTNDESIAALFGGKNKINVAANKIQETIGEYTESIITSLDDIKDASKDFKEIYDDTTGSMFYENKRLAEAFSDVEKLSKGTSFADYLKLNIDEIDKIASTFTDSAINTLLSQDPKDMAKQIEILNKLQGETGLVFENGAKDALDFMKSINLVSESLISSKENIKEFEESFKTQRQLTREMALQIGVSVARTNKELMSLFESLKGGLGGLTDSELEFLNANKSLIESSMDLAMSVRDTVSELKGGITGSNSLSNSIATFWEKRNKIDSLLALNGNLTSIQEEELSSLVDEVNSLSKNIQSEYVGSNSIITKELIGNLTQLENSLNFDNQILSVNIVGVASNISLIDNIAGSGATIPTISNNLSNNVTNENLSTEIKDILTTIKNNIYNYPQKTYNLLDNVINGNQKVKVQS